MSRALVSAALSTALLLLASQVGAAAGDCSGPDPTTGHRVPTQFLFSASVDSVHVTWEGDARGYRVHEWSDVLTIGTVYRGQLADHLDLHGFGAACDSMRGSSFEQGDQLMVAVNSVDLGVDQNGFASPLLIWHATDAGWSLYTDVLPALDYTNAMRTASTTAEIVDLVTRHLPDTATVPAPANGPSPFAPLLPIAAVLGLLAVLHFDRAIRRRRVSG
jgi:hypothetical protein